MIRQIPDAGEKRRIARKILEALPDWFGILEARESYIEESADQLFFPRWKIRRPSAFFV